MDGINLALDNIREKDFIKREGSINSPLYGQIAYFYKETSIIKGTALVSPSYFQGGASGIGLILICEHPTDNLALYIRKYNGVITDHGGMSCHAATIAREAEVPCIVGTGDATKRIKTGDRITMYSTGEIKIESCQE